MFPVELANMPGPKYSSYANRLLIGCGFIAVTPCARLELVGQNVEVPGELQTKDRVLFQTFGSLFCIIAIQIGKYGYCGGAFRGLIDGVAPGRNRWSFAPSQILHI